MNICGAPVLTKENIQLLKSTHLFNGQWYLEQYPDVALLGMDPAEHYLWLGGSLGRAPSPDFDADRYVRENPERIAAGQNPLLHYLRLGRREGLIAHPVSSASQGVQISQDIRSGPTRDVKGGRIPHYGKGLHDLVQATRSRMKEHGASQEYDVIRSEFDIAYYLARYKDIARAPKIDPIEHYVKAGAREGRDPSPHFSTEHYRARYPEVDESGLNPFYHWLTIGREKGYIAEAFREFESMCQILGRPPLEVQSLLNERRNDLRHRLEHGKLGEMVAKAAELDPLVAHSWPEALQVKLPPFHSDKLVSRVVALHRAQTAAEFRRARYVVVVNRPRWGGGRRIEGHILHALARRHSPDDMLVVTTEEGGDPPLGRFPDGVRHVDLAGAVERLIPQLRMRVLVEFLRSLRPEAVFNVNSRLMWDALTPYGKALSATTPVYACLFCNEQTRFGFWTGYPAKFFYRHFDVLAGVCCDSHYLADYLCQAFMVPSEQQGKIAVLEAPVDPEQPVAPAPAPSEARRPQIFWSGRFDRQKRVDLVYDLARRMPEADFRMWGEEVLDSITAGLERPENVIVEGKYDSFADLPLAECDLWLYTSEWDGVPSLLLEVAMTGVPLVGSVAGGTGEILQEGLSWPVHDIDDVGAYEAAIHAVLRDPTAARHRAIELRDYLVERRTVGNYLKTIETILATKGTE